MENVTLKKCQKIRVEGIGEEKHKAFAHALNQIHGKVLKEKKDVIARIEPLAIKVLKAEEETYQERFLLFFMPRVRLSYRVLLAVEVEITMVAMEEVVFVEKKVKKPNQVPFPFWPKGIRKEVMK